MHRNKLKELLNRYHPNDNDEKRYKKQMLEFLKSNKDCFERTCKKGHFTASAWLLNKDLSKVLFTHHAKFDKWIQLGGHCDGDPDILGVAIKEAQEESGIDEIIPVFKDIFDIEVHLVPKYKNEPIHYHYDIRFLLKVVNDDTFKISKESKDLKWFGKDKSKLPNHNRYILRMFDKWIDLKK